MKIKLFTDKVVTVVDEYGPEQSIRSAELAGVPAEMSYADSMLLNIASVLVVVTEVDGKTIQEITGDAVKSRDLLLNFRKAFDNAEWKQLTEAIGEVFALDPKPTRGFEILS